jgi:hypothetical protein
MLCSRSYGMVGQKHLARQGRPAERYDRERGLRAPHTALPGTLPCWPQRLRAPRARRLSQLSAISRSQMAAYSRCSSGESEPAFCHAGFTVGGSNVRSACESVPDSSNHMVRGRPDGSVCDRRGHGTQQHFFRALARPARSGPAKTGSVSNAKTRRWGRRGYHASDGSNVRVDNSDTQTICRKHARKCSSAALAVGPTSTTYQLPEFVL